MLLVSLLRLTVLLFCGNVCGISVTSSHRHEEVANSKFVVKSFQYSDIERLKEKVHNIERLKAAQELLQTNIDQKSGEDNADSHESTVEATVAPFTSASSALPSTRRLSIPFPPPSRPVQNSLAPMSSNRFQSIAGSSSSSQAVSSSNASALTLTAGTTVDAVNSVRTCCPGDITCCPPPVISGNVSISTKSEFNTWGKYDAQLGKIMNANVTEHVPHTHISSQAIEDTVNKILTASESAPRGDEVSANNPIEPAPTVEYMDPGPSQAVISTKTLAELLKALKAQAVTDAGAASPATGKAGGFSEGSSIQGPQPFGTWHKAGNGNRVFQELKNSARSQLEMVTMERDNLRAGIMKLGTVETRLKKTLAALVKKYPTLNPRPELRVARPVLYG